MDGWITTEVATLGDLLLAAANRQPDRVALLLPAKKVTYAKLAEGALTVARALAARGVPRGAHVGLLVPNSVEYAEALFGIALLGCVAVPINVRYKSTELAYIIANAELSMILTSRHGDDPTDFCALLENAVASPTGRVPVALIRGESGAGAVGAMAFRAASGSISVAFVENARRAVRVRDTALIIYTSGTTANPKGCVLSHEAVTRGPAERARYRLSAGEHDVTWGAGPLFHVGSLAPFVGSIGAAGTYLTDTHFDAGRALDLLADHGATLAWPWFSAIAQGLLDHPRFDPVKLGELRYLFIIAPPTLVERVQAVLPHTEVLQACGMTETGGIFALADRDEARAVRSVTHGRAAPGVELRIVDPVTRVDLPDGSLGEVLVRGFNVMDRYWNAPEKTAESLSVDGWLATGDLYTRLPDGNLVFGGRYKDMLKVGGENVAAVEVEAFLCTHPDVKTAEVVGRPDTRLDEVPVAFVELRPGSTATPDDLIAHCAGRIARYKVPRAVYLVAAGDWPMSSTKIDKRALRERLKELA